MSQQANTLHFVIDESHKEKLFKVIENQFQVKELRDVKPTTYLLQEKELAFKLKDQDLKVLSFLKQGLKYKDIAKEMDMTIDGVRYYTKKIYKKLEVNNALAAVDKVFS